MGRFSESLADDEAETGIDMSPLIDCVFILLIFFIVTTVFVDETGVEVEKPQAAAASPLEKTSLLIGVTANGEVFADNRNIGLGGVQPLVRQMMLADPVPVIIQADKNATADILVKVVGEATAAGAETVSVSALAQGG